MSEEQKHQERKTESESAAAKAERGSGAAQVHSESAAAEVESEACAAKAETGSASADVQRESDAAGTGTDKEPISARTAPAEQTEAGPVPAEQTAGGTAGSAPAEQSEAGPAQAEQPTAGTDQAEQTAAETGQAEQTAVGPAQAEQPMPGTAQAEQAAAETGQAEQAGTDTHAESGEKPEKPVRTGSRYPEKNLPSAAVPHPTAASHRAPAPQKPEDRQKRKKWIRTGLIVAACLFAALYIGTAVYFKDHFYQNTVIFGIDCSQKTIDEVKEEVAEKLDQYRLVIEERGGQKETLDAEQIGLEFLDNNSIDAMLKKQYSFIWPVMSNRNKKDIASIAFTYDPKKTEESFFELDCMDPARTVAPKDAYITVHPDGYQVEKEIQGNTLDEEKAIAAIETALDEGADHVVLDDDCYRKPEILQDDEALNAEADAKNAITQARIVMDFGDKTEIINAKTLDGWMTQLDDGTYVIDNMFVEDFVNYLADTYDTFGLPHVFHTAYGTDLTLYDGDYGWMMARDETTLKLVKAINEGYQGELEPEYWYSAMSRGTNDIGGTYVEVCIQDQRMMFFKDWECIVDTPVVTGNPSRGNGTPTGGVWAIDAKMRNYTLVGQGYRAPVDYWLPFNGNVGIHDLQSRGAFGGSIYLYAGSHGCVNTPYDAVSVIYENVSIGTPVIVYASPTEP